MSAPAETIAAIATAPGVGGIGVVRIAGPKVPAIAEQMLGALPRPRHATRRAFHGEGREVLDEGIALYFPAPGSFIGDDVLELQGHGGPVVLDRLLSRAVSLGARLARPGEFTERAFLNGKIDLTQAEAIADLIEASTTRAASLAVRNLQGELGAEVARLAEDVMGLRTHLEASLDFPEDELEGPDPGRTRLALTRLYEDARALLRRAEEGRLYREGVKIVIGGPPNVGKSSLLNALCGAETAIVTEVPGTTRDLIREHLQIDGLPIHLLDTAGLRITKDVAEAEGIKRARGEMERADLVLWAFDASETVTDGAQVGPPDGVPVTWVRNKIDLTGEAPAARHTARGPELSVSALTGDGIDLLRAHIKTIAGVSGSGEGELLARRRHIRSLELALAALDVALKAGEAGRTELLAEDLREVQRHLGEITGEVSTEDLLERIFSSFCIGK